MRTLLIFIVLCVACDDEPPSEPAEAIAPAKASAKASTPAEAPTKKATGSDEPPTNPGGDIATTAGFIEAKVDGELKRYEYLKANHNQVTSRMTVLEALAGPEGKEGVKLTLGGVDVRTVELPAVIKREGRRMPGLNYYDEAGNRHLVLFMDDSLQCQSLENLVLTCTFSGTGRSEEGETVELTEGRLEVALRENAPVDRIMDGLPNVPGQ